MEGKMPITVKGKYNSALVFAKALEAHCEDKIKQYLDQEPLAGTKVRIMPDVHLGKGAVIGFTATFSDLLVPAIVGVDIGCGVCACSLGRGALRGALRLDKLDSFIRKNIPFGMGVREGLHEKLDAAIAFVAERCGVERAETARFKSAIRALCERQGHTPERAFASLGTLGGGNHFIEIDSDEHHNRYLVIHSGSRIVGARTAEYHEIIALRDTVAESPLKYLSGTAASDYCADVALVQYYARINRALMALTIAEGFFKVAVDDLEYRESVHNYLDIPQGIVRKGAISAAADEPVIIPFSMSEGAVLGRGRGNVEWNNSAPHGAGRKMSRSQARSGLSLDEYRRQMRGVWSSTVGKETLDESPMAYKRPKDVLEYLSESIEVEQRLRPVYNFKAVD
jgi:RNA-splicing ligase RtcB